MIVEGAFIKLPELLTSKSDHSGTLEATVVNLFSVATIMEMNSRNIPKAFEHIHQEKPYPLKGTNQSHLRADLFVGLDGIYSFPARMGVYGARLENWIEVKTFFRSTRASKSQPPKTANIGRILRDIFRLCLFPSLGSIGRYLLLVFADNPSQSLSLNKGNEDREWLSRFLTEGYQDFQIDLSNEPKSLRQSVGQGFVDRNWITNLSVHTMMFQPNSNCIKSSKGYPLFWGYLMRIIKFDIESEELYIQCEDMFGQTSCSDLEHYKSLQNDLIKYTQPNPA